MNLNTDGSFEFTPTTDFTGKVTFAYQAADGDGARSALTTVEITVNPQGGTLNPWHNFLPDLALDVSGDGFISPIDALQVINDLNQNGSRLLPAQPGGPPYLDVNNDLNVSPIDALQIINFLNGLANAEGEASPVSDVSVADLSPRSFVPAAWLSVQSGQMSVTAGPSPAARPATAAETAIVSPTSTASSTRSRWEDVIEHLAVDTAEQNAKTLADEALEALFGDEDWL